MENKKENSDERNNRHSGFVGSRMVSFTLNPLGGGDETTNTKKHCQERGRLPVWQRKPSGVRNLCFPNIQKGGVGLWMRKTDAGFSLGRLDAKNSESVAIQKKPRRINAKNTSLVVFARLAGEILAKTRQFPKDEYNAKADCPQCTLSYCRGFDGIQVFCRECYYQNSCTKQTKFPSLICDHCRKEALCQQSEEQQLNKQYV
jgi:hypothetical protein